MSRKWPEAPHTKLQAKRTGAPRPFLPPSYYAAAGGLPYPRKQTDHPASDRPPTRPRPRPVPAASESDASLDLRANTLPADVEPTHPSPAKRQGLPNVEAELLPSLQSTIHRMTRPPSRILADATNTHLDAIPKRKSTLGYNGQQDEPATPKSRIPQKSPLKSALRTGVQKPALSPQTPVPSSPHRNSLRSVKSLLSRRQPSAPTTPLQIASPVQKSNTPHTPASYLPRPKFKPSTPSQPTQLRTTVHTDESDVENRYQRQWMERRRLTVANAEVIPSGSSSDGSLDYDNLPTPKIGTYSQRPEWSQNMGLGFQDMHQPTSASSPLLPNMEFPGERERAKILRFSLPPSNSDASLYSNHHLSYPGSWNDSDYATEQEDDHFLPAARALSMSGRIQAPTPANHGYWRDDLSGSDSGAFSESAERLNVRAVSDSRARAHAEERDWDEDGSRTPVPIERPSFLPRPTPQRVTPRDYREQHPDLNYSRSPSSLRHTGQPWMSPMQTQMRDASNAWFNESSGDYEDEFDHISLTPRRRAPFPAGYEASSLLQQSKRHADQQREAFGIPPSSSDQVVKASRAQRWSQSDSYRSSVASTRWEWNEVPKQDDMAKESLSVGAETMLKSLHPEWTSNMPAMSAASSLASFYEDSFETATEDDPSSQNAGCTPRMPDSFSLRKDRLKHESREDIILEFLHSEEAFLSNTQICVDIFILPIRTQNSRSWIGGVPENISRFLDWYEDIVNLHLAIYRSLESSAAMQESHVVISGLANYLGEFVGKLHVYQPYLVNLADVLEDIAFLVSDNKSDFGEFMRIQEKSLKSMGWTLERLLMEPVNRLAAYQDLFSDLLESTPQDHPEFLTTMMLSRSADTVMRVMTEISDPAVCSILASRDRRLLVSGTLRLVSPSFAQAATTLTTTTTTTKTSGQPSSSHQAKAQKRSSKLVQAIAYWDRKPERSSSMKSTASSVTASVKSFNTMSSYGPPTSLDSRSARMPLFRGLFKGKATPANAASSTSSVGKAGAGEVGGAQTLVQPGSVQAFVFSDIILLVLPKPTTVDSKYTLVPKVGLSRVFSVSMEEDGPSNEIRVQLVLVNPDSIKKDALPRFARITEAVFQLPEDTTTDTRDGGGHPNDNDSNDTDDTTHRPRRSSWIQSFDRCAQDTLQLLSCPGPRKNVPSERKKDTWMAVSALLSSGLPMPKSPSGNLPDLLQYVGGGGAGANRAGGSRVKGKGEEEGEARKQVEREERGWWSLRYQEVLGELIHPVVDYGDGDTYS